MRKNEKKWKRALRMMEQVEFTVSDSHGFDIGDIITISPEAIAYRIEHINCNAITAIFGHFIEDWFREAVRLAVEKR